MRTIAAAARTPRYVLMQGNQRIGPRVTPARRDPIRLAFYGFSSASSYHRFCRKSEQALTPYPLVKVYLRMRAAELSDDLKLVILDAAGPRDSLLQAATVEAVLEAHENGTPHVTAEFELHLDREAGAYSVELETE